MTISEVLKVATVAADSAFEWMTDNGYWPNTDEDADFYRNEALRMVHKVMPEALESIGIVHTEA